MAENNIGKRLYPDVCTLCRPYDDQRQIRVRLETDAVYLILEYIHRGLNELIVSPVHFREIEAIENTAERTEVLSFIRKYGKNPSCILDEIRKRAEQLCDKKIGIADSAHLAFAEATSDIFITCDDKLIKKSYKASLNLTVMNPVKFCITEELR